MSDLAAEVEQFLAITGMSESRFGLETINDAKLVKKLRTGRRCWPETSDRIREFIRIETAKLSLIKLLCTEDGTWIAVDKASGRAHSARSKRMAIMNLRRNLSGEGAV